MTEKVLDDDDRADGAGVDRADGADRRAVAAGEVPLERVEAELCTLAGQIAAATSRFLRLLADFDARRGWAEWEGARSCAHWLSWRCGLDLRTAREHLRVARSLSRLPRVQEAFDQGRLSYSKVRAVARVATPDNEADLLHAALHAPASQLERLTRGLRRADTGQGADPAADVGGDPAADPDGDPDGDADRDPDPAAGTGPDPDGDDTDAAGGGGHPAAGRRRTGVRWRWDDDGELVIWGRLSAEDGARLLAGLTRAAALRDTTTETTTASDLGGGTGSTDDDDDGGAGGGGTPGGPDGSAEPAPATRPDGSAEPPRARPDLVTEPPNDLAAGLVTMAELTHSTVTAPTFAPAAEVLVHADAETLIDAAHTDTAHNTAGAPGAHGPAQTPAQTPAPARFDDGPPLRTAVLRRLACDAGIRVLVRSRTGTTLDIGRRRRRPTYRQLLALWHRDRGCIVPGCGATRFLHAHHVTHWLHGGTTSLDNLVLLCGQHHRALHHGQLHVIARGHQRFDVTGPGGGIRPPAPTTTGNADDLATDHPDITPDTLTPDWDGTGLDLADAVGTYLHNWQLAKDRQQAANNHG